MDTPIWDLDFNYNGQQDVKVSCHVGDFGARAICNMIGDQPLFYIEDSLEEDDLFLEEEIMDFSAVDPFPMDEKFMAKIRRKIESYEKSAQVLSNFNYVSTEEAFDALFKIPSGKTLLKDVLNYGQKSAIFKTYFDFTIVNGIAIEVSNTIKTSTYDRDNAIITLNPSLDVFSGSIALMKSMRMAWNHKQGVFINPLSFQPEEAILINRLIHADMGVCEIGYLWDLKLAGEEDAWAIMMNSADYDLCSAYAMEAMTDFRSIKNGLAARATFEKWFLSGRCKSHDREIIQKIMGGHTDIDIDSTDMSRGVAIDLISTMGQRPGAQNYLAPAVVQIMNDPLYSEVRDRSNANFLWFVTFESRMSELEQELQDTLDDVESTTSEIIPMPNRIGDAKGQVQNTTDGVASIFFLDHFRAG